MRYLDVLAIEEALGLGDGGLEVTELPPYGQFIKDRARVTPTSGMLLHGEQSGIGTKEYWRAQVTVRKSEADAVLSGLRSYIEDAQAVVASPDLTPTATEELMARLVIEQGPDGILPETARFNIVDSQSRVYQNMQREPAAEAELVR